MDWGVLQAKAISLHSAMQYNVDKLKTVGLQVVIESAVTSYVMSDRVSYSILITGINVAGIVTSVTIEVL